jgi:transcriptional regulator with XRE-family HTH domain
MAQTVGKFLREQRAKKKVMIRQVCKKARISTATLWRVETDTPGVSLETLEKIGKVYGLSLEQVRACRAD